MSLTRSALVRRLACLEAVAQNQQATPAIGLLKQDPAQLLMQGGIHPDPWQEKLLRSEAARVLLLCARQTGKSTVAAALALRVALLRAPALVLLLSPTLRQSGELFRDKVMRLYHGLGRPVPAVQRSSLTMGLANGSRIISLPGDEASIRGYSNVSLLIVDEAARVPDALYLAIRPMLAVSRGQLVCLSTPFGKRGWFYEAWTGDESWERLRITAPDCPRISPEFLAEEERTLGQRWFAQEYLCNFAETVGQVFADADIQAAFACDIKPLFPSEDDAECPPPLSEEEARALLADLPSFETTFEETLP